MPCSNPVIITMSMTDNRLGWGLILVAKETHGKSVFWSGHLEDCVWVSCKWWNYRDWAVKVVAQWKAFCLALLAPLLLRVRLLKTLAQNPKKWALLTRYPLTICHTCMMLSSETLHNTQASFGFQEKSEILAVWPPWMNYQKYNGWEKKKMRSFTSWSRD